MQTYRKPYPIERILSVATYLTAGGVGFIWLIIAAVMKRKVAPFLMYHILQSIFISILYFLLVHLGNLLLIIIYKIPIINLIPILLMHPISIAFNMSIVQIFTTTIIIYLVITSGMGYYSYLPWVSNIIKINSGSR